MNDLLRRAEVLTRSGDIQGLVLMREELRDAKALIRELAAALAASKEPPSDHPRPRETAAESLSVDTAVADALQPEGWWRAEEYRDAYEVLAAEVRRLAPSAVAQWRPIESAPKRAEEILVRYTDRYGNVRRVVAHWADGGGEEQPRFRGWFMAACDGFVELPHAPTQWMPLPDVRSPTENTKRQGDDQRRERDEPKETR